MYFQVYIHIQMVILMQIILVNLDFSRFLERKLDYKMSDC